MTLHVRELPALRLTYLRHTDDYGPALGDLWNALGACRTGGVESEHAPQREPFSPCWQPHSGAMG
ncbi:MAG: hypothetical protein ACK40S_14165, partial [Burkholderiaceae bacterium]